MGTWNASVVYAEDNGSGKRVVTAPGGSKGSQSGSYGMLDADTGAVLATVSPNGGNAALDHGNPTTSAMMAHWSHLEHRYM